jgi:hypothetical protein
MGKAFVEMRYKKKGYKLNVDDIGKVYKITKKSFPSIPSFEERNKPLLETDDDTENTGCVNA